MDPLNQSQKMSAKVGKDDNFEAGSPAALWSCLIVFRGDPPPENFEQLTFGENIYWTDGFKVHGPSFFLKWLQCAYKRKYYSNFEFRSFNISLVDKFSILFWSKLKNIR